MRRFLVALLVFETIALAYAAGQTASSISCGEYPIRAGEQLKVQLKFDTPLNVDGAVILVYAKPSDSRYAEIDGNAQSKLGTSQYDVLIYYPTRCNWWRLASF